MLRTIRKGHKLTVKDMSARIGVSAASLGNAESGPFQSIGRKRVERMIVELGLDAALGADLLAAWLRCGPSPFQEAQRKRWAEARVEKATAKSARQLAAELELANLRVASLERNDLSAERWRAMLVNLLCEVAHAEGAANLCSCYPETADHYGLDCSICAPLKALGLPRAHAGTEDDLLSLPPRVAHGPGSGEPKSSRSNDTVADFG